MKNEIKTRELKESARKAKNLELYGDHSDSCICCGKRQNDKKTEQKYVHMSESWLMVNTDKVNDDGSITGHESNSQGFFPIGNTCSKKYPKEFIFELAGNIEEVKEVEEVENVEEVKEIKRVKKSKGAKASKKELSNNERKLILAEFIELLVQTGHDIKPYLCKHLGYFDFDVVSKSIKDLKKQLEA